MRKDIKIKATHLGNYTGPYSIYHTAVQPYNLIDSNVSQAELLAGKIYLDQDFNIQRLFIVSENSVCNQTTEILDILNIALAPSVTPTATVTPTVTVSTSITPTPTVTATPTISTSPGLSVTPTVTVTPTISISNTPTPTPTPSPVGLLAKIDPIPTCVEGGDWRLLTSGFANYRLELQNAEPGTTYTVTYSIVSQNNAVVSLGQNYVASFTSPSSNYIIDKYFKVDFLDTSVDPNATIFIDVVGSNGQQANNGTGVYLNIVSAEEFNNILDCQ